ncbi:MAG: DNA polymerase [Sporolactobacillus sp.]
MSEQLNRGHPAMPSLILPKKHLSIDIETFSSVDIRKSGSYKYIQSPDFEILLFAFSFNGAPVQIIDMLSGEVIPANVIAALSDPSIIKHAYNAAFEWYALNKFWNSPIEQWQDTMIHGLYCGFTSGLDVTAKVLGLPQDKQKMAVGRNLIKIFCTPTTPTARNGNRKRILPHHEPEKWQLFKDYNGQDVVVEMTIEQKLSKFPVPEDVWQQWRLDMQINAHGIQLDRDLIDGALHIDQVTTEALKNEAKQLTELSNPNSAAQLSGWLAEHGVETDNLQKDTVKDLVKGVTEPKVKRVLEIRQQLSKTSIKKYKAMADTICADGRVRGLLQFYGANRSGREAGRLVQVQNLSKNHMPGPMLNLARQLVKDKKPDTLQLIYGNAADTLSQLVRTAFIAAPGHKIVVADFKAIEARVIAWVSGEQWRLDVFNTHEKIYEASASQMFGVPIESISHGDPMRQQGKVAELANGYGGSVGAMKRMDFGGKIRPADMSKEACRKWGRENGMPVPDEVEDDHQIQLIRDAMIDANYLSIVQRWRKASPNIVRLWRSLENAALSVMRDGRPSGTHGLLFARESDIANGLDFLTIQLPSKRKLYYVNPFLAENQFDQESLWYFGMDQTTHKWIKISTYGGKLTENICQAIARDCLFYAMTNLAAAGYQTVMTIHDEVVLDVPAERANLGTVIDIMKQPIPWAPGLPLNADGFVNDYYKKDD